MSTYIVTRRTMDVVITALSDANHSAFRRAFAGITLDTSKATMDAIGRKLWDLNARAVKGRYEGEDEMANEGFDLAKTYKWQPSYFPTATRLQLRCRYLKALRCLRYQCAEDATMDDPLFAELTEVIRDLALAIVDDLPDYAAVPWDSTEQDVPSKVFRLI